MKTTYHMPKNWHYHKLKIIGFEGGIVPSRAPDKVCNYALWPVVFFHKYDDSWLYGRQISFVFLRWYIAIKWKHQPDE